MNFNQIDILLKGRTNLQATNLGFVTARRYFASLLSATLLAVLPIFVIAVMLTVWFDAYGWAGFLLWWCKPFYDRVILDSASRLLFKDKPSFTSQVESLGRACKNGLWLNLTFFRLSPARQLTIPIFLLEKVKGSAYKKRVKQVTKGSSGSATSTLIGLFHIEAILYINCFFLMYMFLPESIKGENIKELFKAISQADEYMLAVGLLALQTMCMMIVEIFFVMTGFMLYLNNRVKAEGWDIELGLKQTADRLAASRNLLPIFATAVIMAFTVTASVKPATAMQTTKEATITVKIDPEGDKAILKKILQEPEINPYKIIEIPIEKKKKTKKKELKDIPDYINRDYSALANIFKLVLVLVALFLVFLLIINRQKFAHFFGKKAKISSQMSPEVMFGLDIRKETLPADIADEARRLLNKGDKTAAMSLLYRGSLSMLVSDYKVVITESDTEGDCLAATRSKVNKVIYQHFKAVTASWQHMVYAHESIPAATIEQLIDGWRPTFSNVSQSPDLNSEAI